MGVARVLRVDFQAHIKGDLSRLNSNEHFIHINTGRAGRARTVIMAKLHNAPVLETGARETDAKWRGVA